MAKIIVLASLAESLINFRGRLLSSLVNAGHEVIACAPEKDQDVEKKLENMGVEYRVIKLCRAGISPISDLTYLFNLCRLFIELRPDIVLAYTIKPVIFGSLAARFISVPQSYSIITGLGYTFLEKGDFEGRFLKFVVQWLYRLSLLKNQAVFFQNPDDLSLFTSLKLVRKSQKTVLVNGSGVDLDYFCEVPFINDQPEFLLIARLLKDKGLVEYVEAAKVLKSRYRNLRFHLVGPLDSNPSAINESQLEMWHQEGIINFHGEVADVRPYIAATSIYVLPSYREGTPRSVLEAMAMGRPIITTNAPGCRETVVEGENGFLVPIKNAEALAQAMERFILDPNLIKKMGQRSRKIAVEKFDVYHVNSIILRTMGLV